MSHPQTAPQPRAATGDGAGTPLTRVTANLTPRGMAALNAVTTYSGDNRTDAINSALRAAAVLLHLTRPDGTLHVIAPDGTTHVVHLP